MTTPSRSDDPSSGVYRWMGLQRAEVLQRCSLMNSGLGMSRVSALGQSVSGKNSPCSLLAGVRNPRVCPKGHGL